MIYSKAICIQIYFLKKSYVPKLYRISITLLSFLICLGKSSLYPSVKIRKVVLITCSVDVFFDLAYN